MPPLVDHLVGRAAELLVFDAAVADLDRRVPAIVEVVGEPGMGKTRMLAELGARADRAGRLVLAGTATELEGDMPFWVFVDALDDHVAALEPRRLDLIGDDARAVLPSLRRGGAVHADRHHAHRAVRGLLELLAQPKGLVLLLDDLHWADAGSIELLGALLRRPPAGGVLLALAMRPRQTPERLAGALERAERSGDVLRLELAPLTETEAAAMLGRPEAEALHRASGGNPFYLQQLARVPRRTGGAGTAQLAGVEVPRAVAAALTDELAGLPPDVRRVLDGAAVAGDPFEPELAAAAAGVDEPTVMEALDELLRRDLVRPTDVPRRFRFRHPLVRGAVHEATPGGWLLGAHERAAALLAARGVPPEERAHHVERAARHGDLEAVAVLRAAGEAAALRAPATAARRFGAALRLLPPDAPDRVPLLMALAEAGLAAGAFADAYEATVECLPLLPADDAAARVGATALCASLAHLTGRHAEAHARLVGGLEDVVEDSPEGALLMNALAVDGFYRLDFPDMRRWAERSLAAARAVGDPALLACGAAGLALSGTFGEPVPDTMVAEATRIVDGLGDDDAARCLDFGVMCLAGAELFAGRLGAAARHAERALRIARATGRGEHVPVMFWTGTVRRMRGDLDGAAELFDTAIEITRVAGHTLGQGWNLQGRAFVAVAAGDPGTALQHADEAVDLLRGDGTLPAMWAAYAQAAALAVADRPDAAADALLAAGGGPALPRVPLSWRPGAFELLTRCGLAAGRPETAAAAAEAAEAEARGLGLPLPRAFAERAAAAVALDRGDAGAASVLALASAEGFAAAGAALEAAASRVVAGVALGVSGRTEQGGAQLQRAAADYDARGAVRRRDEAERQLRRLGHKRLHRRTRPGTAESGIDSLTERELQVARLVVDRLTNPQIAAELFLSQKTVETHIRNLFAKLSVSSRVEVARAVERADRHAP